MGGSRFSRSWPGRRARPLELAVEVGQVVCPANGITDIERCFTCGSYRGMQDGASERLVCAPSSGARLAYVPFGFVPR